VLRQGKALVPSFTAFAVTKLLRDHFGDFVETDFTAEMEDDLDEISRGERESIAFLKQFYFGDKKHRGLLPRVEDGRSERTIPCSISGPSPRAASLFASASDGSVRSCRLAKGARVVPRRCPMILRPRISPSKERWSSCARRPKGLAVLASIPPRDRTST
jgi:hypothetical protein